MRSKKQTFPSREEILNARRAVIEEIGALDAEVKAFKPKQDRLKLLKETAVSWSAGLPAAEAAIYDGELYSLQVSEQEYETAITSMEAVFDLVGKRQFLAMCSMTLKALNAHLKPAQVAEVTKRERTGSRSVKPLRRAAAA